MHQNASFQHRNPTNDSLLQNVLRYSFICTKFSKMIFRKIIKIVAKRRRIFKSKMHQIRRRLGELTVLPQTHSWIEGSLYF